MILVSNHLLRLGIIDAVEEEVVVRVNMAYVKDYEELEMFVDVPYDIFLDYPRGRTKPPTPSMGTSFATSAIYTYHNIKYFSISNIETESDTKYWRSRIPNRVHFVPKIETRLGVENLPAICKHIKYAMLDSEDLYTDVGGDAALYLELKAKAKRDCQEAGVHLLELQGVVFA